MRLNIFNSISSYTNWIITTYQAIIRINSTMPVLRLISEERDKQKDGVQFIIQVIGKNIFPILSLNELENPEFFSKFSKKDQEIIIYYSHKKADKRIVARTYNRMKKQFTYTIESFDPLLKITKTITINEIELLTDDLLLFDVEDRNLIKLELQKKLC